MKAADVIQRYPGNPILTAADISYPATLIFNAGVCKFHGRYVMLFRNDHGGQPGSDQFAGTNLGLAFSADGIHWQAEPQPWIDWHTDEILRAYDPRLTVVDGRCYICFAADTRHGIRGGVAVTDDFREWEVLSLSAPDNRNMVLFPEKIGGKFARLERPFPVYGRAEVERFDLWYAESPDGRHWGGHELVLAAEDVPWANAKIGPGAPPIRTGAGWLTVFHAVNIDPAVELPAWHPGWHKTYTASLMLLDLERPWVVKAVCPEPILIPETSYEREGFRGHVIFPGGLVLEADGEIKIYYGAADTVTCLATARLDDLLGLVG